MSAIRYSEPFLLSDQGSDRATAYIVGNKIVTLDGKTHVFWSDAVARTMARTYDHATDAWGESVFIGDGTDNHNNPSVTADAQGRLRIAYGPHGPWDQADKVMTWPSGRFRYAVADEPNSLKGLNENEGSAGLGYNATYASLLHTPAGRDCIVYRGGEAPYQTLFQRQRDLGGWENPVFLMRQNIEPQYTFYGANMTCDAKGVLYVGAGFYALGREGSLGCAVLRSTDGGDSWTSIGGQPVDLPIEYNARCAIPHGPAEADPRLLGLGIDDQGCLWATTVTTRPACRDGAILSCWDGSRWESFDLNRHMPDGRQIFDAPMCVDTRGRVHLFVSAYDTSQVSNDDSDGFGHESLLVYHLVTTDRGKSFVCNPIGEPAPGTPNWLPAISQQGPYHPVENPMLLYTCGTKNPKREQEGCRSTHLTKVFCVRVEMD